MLKTVVALLFGVCVCVCVSSQSQLFLSTGDRMWAIFTNCLSATLYISSVSLLIIATLSLLFKPTKQITLIMSSRPNKTPTIQNNSCVTVWVALLPKLNAYKNVFRNRTPLGHW